MLVQDKVAQSIQMKPFSNTTGQNVVKYSVTFGENGDLTTTTEMGSDSEKQNEK